MATKLGDRLVQAGLVTADDVQKALQHQRVTGHRIGDCLVELGLMPEHALLAFLAEQFSTRFVSTEKLSKLTVPATVLERIPVRIAEAHLLLPLAVDEQRRALSLVCAEPQNEELIRELALITEMDEVVAYVGLRSAIQAAIRRNYYGDASAFVATQRNVQSVRADLSAISSAFEKTDPSLPAFSIATPVGAQRLASSAGLATPLRDLGLPNRTFGETDLAEVLNVLVGMIELPKKERRGHSARLARMGTQLAKKLGLQPQQVACLAIAAQLHDLGKPRERHLTLLSASHQEDWRTDARRYLQAPLKLFEGVRLPEPVTEVLTQLYEAYDGSGFPQGLKRDEISFGARILATLDSYLDLTHNPINHLGQTLSKPQALAKLKESAGTLFDPSVVELLEQTQGGELVRLRVQSDGRGILLADPHPTTRAQLSSALSGRGLLVHTVAKLSGVAEALIAGEADMLVASLSFGGPELVATLRMIRASPDCGGTPLVILGAPAEPSVRDRLVNAGALLLPEPGEAGEVAERLSQLMEERIQNGGPGRMVRGSFDELPLPELLQLMERGRKSGRIAVDVGAKQGVLHLERGRLVLATFGGTQGHAALSRLLQLPRANFAYEPEAVLLELPNLDAPLASVLQLMSTPGEEGPSATKVG